MCTISYLLYTFFIFAVPGTYAQDDLPIAFNGFFSADFFKSDQRIHGNPSDSGIGKFQGYEIAIDLSPLYYFQPNANIRCGYRYALGLRTGMTRWVQKYDIVDDYRWYLNVFPMVRYNLKQGSFLELSAGASYTLYRRKWKQPSGNIWAAPLLKYLIWKINLSVGHALMVTDRVYFEPIIGLEYHLGGWLDNPTKDLLKHDFENFGINLRLGFQYRLFK